MSGMTLGWMIIATLPDGRTKALPSSPAALDMLPTYMHATLPTLGGVWDEEVEAWDLLGKIPTEMREHFRVVPVAVTILERGL